VSFLDLARRLREPEPSRVAGTGLEGAPVVEVRERIAAVRVRSPIYGDVWLALDTQTAAELVAEESGIPVLRQRDVLRLRGQNPEMVRAVLEVIAAFPGARMMQ
jgi:hypothetical protein